jgi:PadR family transcriptional regulator PadR
MLRSVELRPPSYFALAALIDGPLHGYAIMRRAAEMSEGSVRVTTGTLYSVLDRALAEGLVVSGDPYVVSGRERRDYELTAAGRLALAQEAEKLTKAARVVGTRLRATGLPAT